MSTCTELEFDMKPPPDGDAGVDSTVLQQVSQFRAVRVTMWTINLTMTALVGLPFYLLVPADTWIRIAVSVAAMGAFIAMRLATRKRETEKLMQRIADSGIVKYYVGPGSLRMTDDAIVFTAEQSTVAVPWKTMKGIEHTPEVIRIWGTGSTIMLSTHECVTPDRLQQFFSTARKRAGLS